MQSDFMVLANQKWNTQPLPYKHWYLWEVRTVYVLVGCRYHYGSQFVCGFHGTCLDGMLPEAQVTAGIDGIFLHSIRLGACKDCDYLL